MDEWGPVRRGRMSVALDVVFDNHRSEVAHECFATLVFVHGRFGWRLDSRASKFEVGE